MVKKAKPIKKVIIGKTTGEITKKSDAKKKAKIVKTQSIKKAASKSKK